MKIKLIYQIKEKVEHRGIREDQLVVISVIDCSVHIVTENLHHTLIIDGTVINVKVLLLGTTVANRNPKAAAAYPRN